MQKLCREPKWIAPYLSLFIDKGMSAEEVSQFTGIHIKTLKTVAKVSGAPALWMATPDRIERAQSAYAMFEDGKTLTEIAAATGTSISVSRVDLALFGVSVRDRNESSLEAKLQEHATAGKTASEAAALIGVSEDTVRDKSKRAGIELETPAFKYKTHGTLPSYRNGCRCDACKAASNETSTEKRRKLDSSKTPADAHGTPRGYWYWQCRCEPCKSSAKEVNGQRYEKIRANRAAPKIRVPWTKEDDLMLLSSDKSVKELAQILKRSEHALYLRKSRRKASSPDR